MATKKKMLQAAAGNAGGGAGLDITDVFSTYLYTGNGSTQTITNGIDLDGEGGLVWTKNRSITANHRLFDTERGVNEGLASNLTNGEVTLVNSVTAFNSNGFSLGSSTVSNTTGNDYASWTFRKAPKFFDVVTYTGNGTQGRTVSHNLGSVPGMIIVKSINRSQDWAVYHRGNTSGGDAEDWYLLLNQNSQAFDSNTHFADTAPTSTEFTVGTNARVNENTRDFVAYLFAHNDGDGEFGPDADQDIIKCGSFTDNGSLTTVNLGFEPQWLLVKKTNSSGSWELLDNMRGLPANQYVNTPLLYANDSPAENYSYRQATSDSTGFTWKSGQLSSSGDTLIYVAIRARDGNVVAEPEAATDVFDVSVSAGSTGTEVSTGFPVDMQIQSKRSSPLSGVLSRKQSLISISETAASNAGLNMNGLQTASTAAEFYNDGSYGQLYNNTGFSISSFYSGASTAYYSFKRARGFFDVVAYTGEGANTVINHNLDAIPEMVWVKNRGRSQNWNVYHKDLELNGDPASECRLFLNTTSAVSSGAVFWGTHTDTTFTMTVQNFQTNYPNDTYIAYLFATLAGVSKVGSYTGNGSSQTINCGFTSGARFILVKRTDSTGDWYVWDTERGIVAGNDPYLELNTTDAEVTSTDWVDPDNSGFIVNGTTINASSASYIFYAIA